MFKKESPKNKYTDENMTNTKVPNKWVELPNTGVDKTGIIMIAGVMILILTTILGVFLTGKKHKND